MEKFLKGTTHPHSDADFTFGRPTKGHAWHAWTWAEFVHLFAEQVRKAAPPGEDPSAWWY
jgi:hypothetical protein